MCLTGRRAPAQEDGRNWFAVDAAAETLAITNVGQWQPGTRLNLERPLKIGDELGGHIVTGHVDGIADVIAREDLPDMARLHASARRRALARFIAHKGSVALDGVFAHGQRGRRSDTSRC